MTPLLLLLIAATPNAEPNWLPPMEAQPAAIDAARYDRSPPAAAVVPEAIVQATKRPFDRRLIALELALSATVVEKPNLWRFDRLESEAAKLLPLAKSEADRAAIRSIADRIDRFDRLSRRLRNAQNDVGQRSPTARGSQLVAEARIAPPVRRTKAVVGNAQHDAIGVLRPVVSKRAGAPKYAVVDDQGRIAALVTPTPEVDQRLKTMLGKRVGLDGQRGYLTDLRREHVVAERVTPLGTLRR